MFWSRNGDQGGMKSECEWNYDQKLYYCLRQTRLNCDLCALQARLQVTQSAMLSHWTVCLSAYPTRTCCWDRILLVIIAITTSLRNYIFVLCALEATWDERRPDHLASATLHCCGWGRHGVEAEIVVYPANAEQTQAEWTVAGHNNNGTSHELSCPEQCCGRDGDQTLFPRASVFGF